MPILEIYHGLKSGDEKESFEETLILWLSDSDKNKQKFAMSICLGFFYFRDVIGK